MNAYSLNDILQAAGVAICLVLAVAWIVRRLRRKDTQCDNECGDCPVKRQCESRRRQ